MASLNEIKALLDDQTKTLKDDFNKKIEESKKEILGTVNAVLGTHAVQIKSLEQKLDGLLEKEKCRTETELQREINERKNNMIFYKIAENEPSQDSLSEAMLRLLNGEVEDSFEMRDIDYIFRLGKKKEGQTRPILIRFVSRIKKELIMKNRKKLADKNIDIADDFPAEIRERRKNAAPTIKSLKEKGYAVSLRGDKIRVNGENMSLEKAEHLSMGTDESNSAKRLRSPTKSPTETSVSVQSKEPSKKPPPLKLPKNQASGSTITNFFSSPKTTALKSPTVIVQTPSKNVQYTDITDTK